VRNIPEFITGDLPTAAFLLALGLEPTCRPSPKAGHAEFAWPDPDGEIARLGRSFYDGKECVAVRYYRSLCELRRVIEATVGSRRGAR
jgi:hypothetical protein